MHKRKINKIKVILLNNFGSRYKDIQPDIREQVFLLIAKEIASVIEKEMKNLLIIRNVKDGFEITIGLLGVEKTVSFSEEYIKNHIEDEALTISLDDIANKIEHGL